MMQDFTDYDYGWLDADNLIQRKLAGENVTGLDYSQGETEYDRGWNARMDRYKLSSL